jgi:hypothetical protein
LLLTTQHIPSNPITPNQITPTPHQITITSRVTTDLIEHWKVYAHEKTHRMGKSFSARNHPKYKKAIEINEMQEVKQLKQQTRQLMMKLRQGNSHPCNSMYNCAIQCYIKPSCYFISISIRIQLSSFVRFCFCFCFVLFCFVLVNCFYCF